MRADRLVATLLLLQQRQQVTAAEVAEELEVSERTARRDLEALSMAGVPVYSRQGRNGGWRLVGGARTDLSGLTAPEARALFLVAGPSSAATPEVKAALRKLVRALPETFRSEAEVASSAIVVDQNAWGRTTEARPTPHLDAVQQAVVQSEQIMLGYVARDNTTTRRVVHPLGLASKGPVWYLVADTDKGLRTFRVDRMTGVEPTGVPVLRPDGFDLATAWRMISDEVDQRRTPVWASGTAAPEAMAMLRYLFGARVRIGPKTDEGRVQIEIGSTNHRALAGEIAGLGGLVVIDEPEEVRVHLAEIAVELSALYS